MHTLFQDLRYATRLLLKQPGFTLIAILTLALGIGANSAIFSIIDAALLRSLPYPQADRLVRVWSAAPERGKEMEQVPVSLPRYETIRDGQDVFQEMAVSTPGGCTLTGRGEPEQIRSIFVSERFFPTLGIPMSLGRSFLPAEDQPGGPAVVVVSRPFWLKHFGGDPSLLGQTLTLDGTPCTVVGVLAAPLALPYDRVDVFVPRVADVPGIPAADAPPGRRVPERHRPPEARRQRPARPRGNPAPGHPLPAGHARPGGRSPGPRRSSLSRRNSSGTRGRRSTCWRVRRAACCSSPASTSPTSS